MRTELTPEIIKKGFKDSFDFILELEKHPEKLEKLPDKGILIRKGKRFAVKSKDEKKLILL